jgi:hypothetical protein
MRCGGARMRLSLAVVIYRAVEDAAVPILRFGAGVQAFPVMFVFKVRQGYPLFIRRKVLIALLANSPGSLMEVAQEFHAGHATMSVTQAQQILPLRGKGWSAPPLQPSAACGLSNSANQASVAPKLLGGWRLSDLRVAGRRVVLP